MPYKRSLSQLRAIFANLRGNVPVGVQRIAKRTALVGGVGAGIYYGGKGLRSFIQQHKEKKKERLYQNVVRTLKGQVNSEEVKLMKKKYEPIAQGLSEESKKRVIDSLKTHQKLERKFTHPRSIKTLLKDFHAQSLLEKAHDLGHETGLTEAQDIYHRKLRNLETISSDLKEANATLNADGLDTPDIRKFTSKGLDKVGSNILHIDPESKLEKGRRWKDKQLDKLNKGEITRQQYYAAVDRYSKFRDRILKQVKRESKYVSKPSPNYYKKQDRAPDAYDLMVKKRERMGRRY